MKGNVILLWLCSLSLCGCFVNYPVYDDDIVKTTQSLPDFVEFAKEKGIRYKSSFGSTRNLGLTSSGIIVTESYDDIFGDQIPGKAGTDVEGKNYRKLPGDFFGAPTGPVPIHGRIMPNSKKALIIIHGLLFSKRTYFIKEFAEIAHREWGFTVITIDLRGHGESLTYPELSVGIYEGLDVCYLAKKLKRDHGMEYVGVLGFSLGGHTTIRAAYEASCEAKAGGTSPVIDAAVAVSPPCDFEMALQDLSGYGLTSNFFNGLFQTRISALKEHNFLSDDLEMENFEPYLTKVVIPHYQNSNNSGYSTSQKRLLTFRNTIYGEEYKHLDQRTAEYQRAFREIHSYEDFLKMASSYSLLSQITIPLLVIHAEDDTTVSVNNANLIVDTVAKYKLDNILVLIVPNGGHLAMHKVDPNWTFNIIHAFHHYYAYPYQREDFQTVDRVCALWYYFDRTFYFSQLRLWWALF